MVQKYTNTSHIENNFVNIFLLFHIFYILALNTFEESKHELLKLDNMVHDSKLFKSISPNDSRTNKPLKGTGMLYILIIVLIVEYKYNFCNIHY